MFFAGQSTLRTAWGYLVSLDDTFGDRARSLGFQERGERTVLLVEEYKPVEPCLVISLLALSLPPTLRSLCRRPRYLDSSETKLRPLNRARAVDIIRATKPSGGRVGDVPHAFHDLDGFCPANAPSSIGGLHRDGPVFRLPRQAGGLLQAVPTGLPCGPEAGRRPRRDYQDALLQAFHAARAVVLAGTWGFLWSRFFSLVGGSTRRRVDGRDVSSRTAPFRVNHAPPPSRRSHRRAVSRGFSCCLPEAALHIAAGSGGQGLDRDQAYSLSRRATAPMSLSVSNSQFT